MAHIGVVFGSMLIGGLGTSISEALRVTTTEGTIELLDIFADHGHAEIDTARMYGAGTTEEMLGTTDWQERGLKMATKLYPSRGRTMLQTKDEYSHSPADLRKGLSDSLAALKANKIDLFYLHAPDRSVPYQDTLREINEMHIAQICEICKANKWILPTVYQGVYNALHRAIEPELIPCLRTYGISFYAYNPLAGGFLTSRYRRDQPVSEFKSVDRFHPSKPWSIHQRARYWNEANFAALDIIRPVIAQHEISETQAALRWLAHQSGDKVILGASGKEHLDENLRALESGPLPAEVVEALEKGWEQARVRPVKYFS